MSVLTLMALSAEDTGGTRIMLLLVVLFAVVLILAGGAIAVFTFYNQRNAHIADSE